MRRSVVNAIGEFNQELRVGQGDWDYNIRMLMMGDIGTIPEPLANYHLRFNELNKDYSNSGIAGEKLHEKYRVLYWNSFVRSALNANPEWIGLVRAVTYPFIESQEGIQADIKLQFEALNRRLDHFETLNRRFDQLEEAVFEMKNLLRKLLAPLRWLYGLTQPFRSIVSRFSKGTVSNKLGK